MLTAEIRKVGGVVSRTMAVVPKESLVEASLTETACPVIRGLCNGRAIVWDGDVCDSPADVFWEVGKQIRDFL